MVKTWSDPCIPDHLPRPPRPLGDIDEMDKVSQLFATETKPWDEAKLRELFVDEDVERIKRIKVSSSARQDLLGWYYNEDGIYTVKSGYWLATHLPNVEPINPTYGNHEVKQKIWKTKVPSKLQHFLWKLNSRCLATRDNLKRRHIIQDARCPRCGLADETEEHLFFECHYAKRIWRGSGISNNIINSSTATMEEKIAECLLCCTSSRLTHLQDMPIWILWRLWKSRNILIFQNKQLHWMHIIRYARTDAQELKTNVPDKNSYDSNRMVRSAERPRWIRPSRGKIKCNVDGSFINEMSPAKAGWIVRDEFGGYREAVQAKGMIVNNAMEGELQGIVMALQHLWIRGYRKVIIESDSKKAVDMIKNGKLHFDAYNWI